TPQQNGVAERRNRTLIEAARTMVLVNKSHNKTPYELFNGRSPAIGFLKPFGCHVMILNTLDHLGKFEAKGDEGTKDATSQEVKKDVSSLRYIALPNWVHDALLESYLSKPQDDCSTDVPGSSGNSNSTATSTNPLADQMETLTVETPIPVVSSPVLTACFTDSQEPSSNTKLISKRVANQVETPSLDNILTLTNQFEDILGVTTNLDESNGVEADVSNMETTIKASPTLTLRIHKDHHKRQIIGPMDTLIQTKNKSKEDERGIVIRNKARLVAQGHTQEEGIDYDEVFAPVTRIEAIKLLLAYASFMGFTVYQMDVKSAFLYGTIYEEVYVMQPLGFQDPEFPARVYKVEKAIYGLHQAPRAWAMGELNFFLGLQVLQKEDGIFLSQDKYVGAILKKFGYLDVRSANTPMDKENPWGKDGSGKDVDPYHYRSMIGSLITASRPDIMFAVCAYARHQVTPKECHLYTVKRIFRYLKGHPKLGLCHWMKCDGIVYGIDTSRIEGIHRILMISSRLIPLSEHNVDFHPIVDFVEASPLRIETTEEETKILATVDGILRTVTESSLRRNLKLKDEEGISSLPDAKLFENLTLMGYNISSNQKFTFQKELMDLCTSLQRQQSDLVSKFEAQEVEITMLKARVKLLEDREGVDADRSGDDAPIKGRRLDEGEEAAEKGSNNTEEMIYVLTSMDAATVLSNEVAEVLTGSGSIPTTGPPAAEVSTGSDVVPTAGLIFSTATVVTPYTRRKGKEKMIEFETPKKKKIQDQMDIQMARQLEEEMEREAQRMNEQIARDAEIARIHAEEELQIMIDGLDRSNETVAKYLQEYHEFSTKLPLERRIELISDLVRYQDNYAKVYKYQSQQRKPLTKKQQREFYTSVLRNQAGWKAKDFKGMTLEEIKENFDLVWKQSHNFIPIGSKEEAERFKRKGIRFEHESVKKLKTSEEVKAFDEVPKEKVKEMMQLVPIEEVYVEALQVKHPIIDCIPTASYGVPTGRRSSTASEESSHCQTKRDVTAEKIALLLKSSINCQSKSYDSYAKLVPHVTPYILGITIQFDGKADEGFLVGYSVTSKAFRVFNSRTRIAQETLHINFLENQPNVAGSGPIWLFDIDTLTQSMNYQLVVAGNQPNSSEGNTDADATFVVKGPESKVHVSPSSSAKTKKHNDKTKIEDKRKSHVKLSTGVRNLSEEFEDFSSNSTNGVDTTSTPITAVGLKSTNSTNTYSATGPSNNVVCSNFELGRKSSYVDPSQYPDDPDMSGLEDITYSDDEEDVGAEVDFSNLESSITVSPIPTSRVHKDHPVTQIIGDLSSAPQTRSMTRMVKDQVDLPNGKRAIGSKWVFRNKKDERGIVVRNKARLVAQGHTHEEGIDYEEVFAPIARNKDLGYPDKVYKVVKALYGLHQAPKACQDKYVAKILRKFGLTDEKSASTYIDTEKPLLKDPDGEDVDVHTYSDYARASLDRKSTTGGCQFLGCRLISCNAKKQTIVAISSTEADYIAAASCCAQVLWIQNQLLDYRNEALAIPGQTATELMLFGLTIDVVNLMLLGHKQFWSSVSLKKTNDDVRLQALIDRRKVIITEDTVRQALRLDDADSIDCLHNEEIFAELARMGVGKGFSGVDTLLFDGMLVPHQVQDDVADAAENEDAANEISAAPTPPSPTPATRPQPQQELILSSSKVKSTPPPSPHQSPIAQLSSPLPQQPPSHDAKISMTLLNTLLETCATLTKQEDASKHEGKIIELDAGEDVTLEEVDAEKDTEVEPAEIEEVLEVVTVDKLMTEVVTTATTPIIAAPVPKASAPRRRRRGVIIQDIEEAASLSVQLENEVIEQVKRKEKQDNAVMRYQALKRKLVIEAQARKNMMVYLKNMAGFKMDFFKGVNPPRCDEDRVEMIGIDVLLYPVDEKDGIKYALMVNPTIYVSCIKQFWSSVSLKRTNDVVRLQALIDRRKLIITKDTVRQALRLDDQVQGVVMDAAEDEDDANVISTKPTPPSPTSATTPPPQQELIPSSSKVESTPPSLPHQSSIAQPS
nr:hypothetical protein [Tanacetum cinerariifolium]